MHMNMKTNVPMIVIAALVGVGVIGYLVSQQTKVPASNSSTVNSTNQDRVESDGTVVKPDGTMVKPDGTMVKPDGTMVKPDGTMIKADGTMVKPDGTMIGPDGKVITENSNTSTNSGSTNTNISANTNATTSSAAPAKYIPYSSSALASAVAVPQGDTILYFHANWCPICQALDPDITKNISQLPIGVTILKVDYDKETDLKKKYGVTYQHTFVQVDPNGNKLKLWNGSTNALAIAGEII